MILFQLAYASALFLGKSCADSASGTERQNALSWPISRKAKNLHRRDQNIIFEEFSYTDNGEIEPAFSLTIGGTTTGDIKLDATTLDCCLNPPGNDCTYVDDVLISTGGIFDNPYLQSQIPPQSELTGAFSLANVDTNSYPSGVIEFCFIAGFSSGETPLEFRNENVVLTLPGISSPITSAESFQFYGSYISDLTLYPNDEYHPVNELRFAWDIPNVGPDGTVVPAGGDVLLEVLSPTCAELSSDITLHMYPDGTMNGNAVSVLNHQPDEAIAGWFDISNIDSVYSGYSGSATYCTCATFILNGVRRERRCAILELFVDTELNLSVNAQGRDDASIAINTAVEQITTPDIFLDDGNGNPIADPASHVYDLSIDPTISVNFRPPEGLLIVDIDLVLTTHSRLYAPLILRTPDNVDPISGAQSLDIIDQDISVTASAEVVVVDCPILLGDLGAPGEIVPYTFSGTLYTDIGGRRHLIANRALEPHKAKAVPFSFVVRARAPGKKRLSPAAYGGIVFAMTFVIGIAGAIAFAAHKRRSNPQVYPAKKSTDAKTLKTSTTISSFGSDRSIDSNIRPVPTGAIKSQRDVESQRHVPRSQRSMKLPTRINDSQHNAKVQRSTKPTKSNKSTTCVGGGDRRPRSHHDAPSSRGSRRNMEHHRVASPRATTGRNGGRSTSQGKPKPSTRPSSLDLHRPNSPPSASLKHHRKERKSTPKCHPSNEELI